MSQPAPLGRKNPSSTRQSHRPARGTSTALLCRSRHSVPLSQFLRALSDDLRSSLSQIEMIVPSFIPEESSLRTSLSQAFSKMHDVHTCMLFYFSITESTQFVAQPMSPAPATRAQAVPETGTGSEAPRTYRDADRQAMPTAQSQTSPQRPPHKSNELPRPGRFARNLRSSKRRSDVMNAASSYAQ